MGLERYVLGDVIDDFAGVQWISAVDSETETDVIVRRVIVDAPDADTRARLVREYVEAGVSAARLEGPNVLRVLEAFEADGEGYHVVESTESLRLSEMLAAGGLGADAACALATQIGAAATAACELGIRPRSMDPQSVFVSADGTAKVSDLGVPSQWSSRVDSCEPGADIAYLSPEEIRGAEVDCRSDVFHLGVLLHQLLTGENPFTQGESGARMLAVVNDALPALPAELVGAKPELQPIVWKATAKDPALRYESTAALVSDLESGTSPDITAVLGAMEAASAAVPQAAPPTKPKREFTFTPAMRNVAIAVAVAVLVLGVGFGIWYSAQAGARKKAAEFAAVRAAQVGEAQTIAKRISELKGLRVQHGKLIKALETKAERNSRALGAWDSRWENAQATYRQRKAAVEAHNAEENAKVAASETTIYDWWGYPVSTTYTYTPQYEPMPSPPRRPSPVRTSLAAEKKAISKYSKAVDDFVASVSQDASASTYFDPACAEMCASASALATATADLESAFKSMKRVTTPRGDVLSTSVLGRVNVNALEAPFAAMDSKYTLLLQQMGITAEEAYGAEATKPK